MAQRTPVRHVSNISISWPVHAGTVPALPPTSSSVTTHNELKKAKSQYSELESGDERTLVWSDLKRWTVDLLSCFVACMALMAIVITLATHDGRTLPNWRFGITVNALVSIFAVIWRAAMVAPVANAISQLKWSWFQKPRPLIDLVRFDEASRGVMGSMWFVGRRPGMHLAWAGGIICVLSIASDPFVQQIVKYRSCLQIKDGFTASVARSNVYAVGAPHIGAGSAGLDYPTQAALYEGVYNFASHIQPTCPTGNCTFPLYNTVGICGGCIDITHELTTHCRDIGEPIAQCNWTLPSGLRLSVPEATLKTMVMRSEDLTKDTEPSTSGGLVSSTQIITITQDQHYDHSGNFSWGYGPGGGSQSALATQCSLWPCVRTYSTVVSNGEASSELLATHNMTFNGTDMYGSFIAAPMPCLINGSYYDESAFKGAPNKTATNRTEYIPWKRPYHDNETLLLPPQCRFLFAQPIGLIEYLRTFLRGHVGWENYVSIARPSWMGQLFKQDDTNFGIINATWTSMAESVTVHMRRIGSTEEGGSAAGNGTADGFGGGPNASIVASAPAAGQVLISETCIAVQWPWLAYPAALLLMTVALLAATVVATLRKSAGKIWKSSPLPLLFFGLRGELGRVARNELGPGVVGMTSSRKMEELATRMMVSFQANDEPEFGTDGPGFVGFIDEKN